MFYVLCFVLCALCFGLFLCRPERHRCLEYIAEEDDELTSSDEEDAVCAAEP